MTPFLISWPGGSLESALRLGGLLLLAYVLVLWLSAVIWVFRDVRSRTGDQASQLIAVVLVAVFNLPGLLVYLVIRPQATMSDAYERSLEAEAILHELQMTANACQACHRPVEDDYNVCPHCRTRLREPCRNCSKQVRTSWVTCPYCATDRALARALPIPTTLAAPPGGESSALARRARARPAGASPAPTPGAADPG
jgi:RNA polymerase subunit RPABC4/transcription elongation factor Spt4